MEQILQQILKKLDGLDAKIDTLGIQVDENTQILKALEHSAQVNKAEHDQIINDIAHIKGDVSAMRKDLTNVEIITSSNWNDIATLKKAK
jgi:restriction endonuclease S subunit